MANLQRIFKELEKEKKLAQKELERLEEAILAFGTLFGKSATRAGRTLSAAARKKIAAAQRARWAKLKRK